MEIITITSKHRVRQIQGLDVTLNGDIVNVTEGVFVDRDGNHPLDAISFEVTDEENVVFDLYIVKGQDRYDYQLIKTFRDDTTFPVYEGPDKLIHTFINIDNQKQIFHIYRVAKSDDMTPLEGGVPDEKAPSEDQGVLEV